MDPYALSNEMKIVDLGRPSMSVLQQDSGVDKGGPAPLPSPYTKHKHRPTLKLH